jgi:hypothetical protein
MMRINGVSMGSQKKSQPKTFEYFNAIATEIKRTQNNIDLAFETRFGTNDQGIAQIKTLSVKYINDNTKGNCQQLEKEFPNDLIKYRELSIAYMCCMVATRLATEGQITEALKWVSEANFWLGANQEAFENFITSEHEKLRQKAFARIYGIQGATKSNKSSTEWKTKVQSKFLEGNYKSKNDAAKKIRKELQVPYEYLTVLKWLHIIDK